MKKKEILIILSLTIVVAGLTAFLLPTSYHWNNFTKMTGGMVVEYGFPFKFLVVNNWPLSLENFILENIFFDLLFWFIVIFAFWQAIKWIKGKNEKRN